MSKTPMQERAASLLELIDLSMQMMRESTNGRPEVAFWTEMFTEQLEADRAVLEAWSDGSAPEPTMREFMTVTRRVLHVLVPVLDDASHHVSQALRLPARALGGLAWAMDHPGQVRRFAGALRLARYGVLVALAVWLTRRWSR